MVTGGTILLRMRGYTDLTGAGAAVRLEGCEIVRLSGQDAESWLQGQVTNDLRRLEVAPFVDACLTKPTGQIVAELRIWRDERCLAVWTTDADAIERRVEQFVIMEDVALDRVSHEVWTWQSTTPVPGGHDSPRIAPFGRDFPARPEGVPEADTEAWLTVCLEHGLPVVGLDSDATTLPPELGARFERDHVAYDKGCYVGQEVLQRIHSRGHTNRTWVVLMAEAALTVGAETRADGVVVGRVTRVCESPRFGHLAGAVHLNRASAVGSLVEVGGTAARVVDPPASVL